jgi:hypothetical protein
MSSTILSRRHLPLFGLLRDGATAGIAGGLAEVLVIALYSATSDTSLATVGRQIAAAVGLDSNSALTGLWVHLALSAALGIALMFAWNRLATISTGPAALYLFASVTLAAIWAINFFIVLPVLSPAFVTLLPYTVTLVSKLMFGGAAARTAQRMIAARASATGHKTAYA